MNNIITNIISKLKNNSINFNNTNNLLHEYFQNNHIVIDNYLFILLYKFQDKQNRNIIYLCSLNIMLISEINEYKYFYVYQSYSELGFWRLACYSNKKRFYKGTEDYIQQSFIHIDLQKFIYKKFDEIDLIQGMVVDKICNNELFIKELNEYVKRLNYSNAYINIISENKNIRNKKIEELNIVNKKRLLTKEFKNIQNKYEIKDYIDNIKRSIIINNFYNYSLTVTCGRERKNINYNENDLNNVGYSILKTGLQKFSKKIEEKYIVLKEDIKILYQYDFNASFSNVILRSFNKIYSVKLRLKENNELFIYLYYMIYNNLKIEENHKLMFEINEDKYIPIFLTTSENTINEYGLSTDYIPSGNYICKVLDYNMQCTKKELRNYKCTDKYTYIGDRYDNLFPFNIIKEFV